MSRGSDVQWLALMNLLVPGAGMVAAGSTWSGLFVGLLFAACANGALWATLLVPDDFSPAAQALAISLAGGAYLGAQIRLAQTVRERGQQQRAAVRRKALIAAHECLLRADYPAALAALEPVRDLARSDLLVAYRIAQVHTAMQDATAAQAAWVQVEALDHHHLYSAEMRASARALERLPRW